MKEQDFINNDLIKKIVEHYFYLEPESLELFKNELTNKQIAPEFSFIGEDLRIRFPLEESFNENFDKGWALFKNLYGKFLSQVPISYKEFRENKKELGSNKMKLKKVISSWCLENRIYGLYIAKEQLRNMSQILSSEELKELAEFLFEKEENKNSFIETANFSFILRTNEKGTRIGTSVNKNGKHVSLYVSIDKFSKNPFYEKIIDYAIQKNSEAIGTQTIPKTQGMEIVFSLNFADWFLCSTAETWNSCLCLYSGYSDCYWAGLPGLVNDKNRIMIYLTDNKKKSYRGIEVDRIISRTWAILTTEDSLSIIREYPGNFNLTSLAEETLKKVSSLKIKTSGNFTAKYPKVPMYFNSYDSIKNFVDIFNDKGVWRPETETNNVVFKNDGCQNGRSKIYKGMDGRLISNDRSYFLEYSGGLDNMERNGHSIHEALRKANDEDVDDYDDYYDDYDEDED